MDFDISAILKIKDGLDLEQVDKLIHSETVEYEDFKLMYLRPKMFRISKGHKTVYFTDLFFIYKTSLDKASETYLNDKKISTIDGNLLNNDITYWIKNKNEIIKYCIKDCYLTAELGNHIHIKTKEAGLPAPAFYSSHASFSKQFFRTNSRITSIKYIPINILDIAYSCYYGGRFELLKKGYFDNLYTYDINSAYPFRIRFLPSLKYGKWIKIKFQNDISEKETIGFYKCEFLIPETYISPLILKHKGLSICPSGYFKKWITWYEYDLLKDFIIDFEYGYEFIETRKEYYPFQEGIDFLYENKAKFKDIDDTFYVLYKYTMNALYGCFIERHLNLDNELIAGVLFNPVYASIITASCRWKLLKDVKLKDWKYLVGFHTDSIISEKKLNYLKIDNKLGNWSLEDSGKSLLLYTGIYQIGNKRKNRGLTKEAFKESQNWIDIFKKNPNNSKLSFPKTNVMKIAEALRRFKNLENVNIFIPDFKELNITKNDVKRNWNSSFLNCKDALERTISSSTLNFKYIEKKELK